MTDTCAHSKDFITVKQRTQAPPSEKMNFFPARSDMCPMVFSVLPRWDAPDSCWKIFRQNCRSFESLPLPLFSCPAHVSTPAHICPSLTDALSIFSLSKWWGSEILMYPLSIMSLIVELHMFIVERERKCDPPGKNRKKDTCLFASALNLHFYGRGLPQLLQNFPLFTCPQLQVQSAEGAGLPHSLQNFPLFTCPQLQVQLPAPAVGCALFTGCCGC